MVAVLCLLILLRSVIFGCLCVRLSAAESTGVSGRQMAELYWKLCGEMFVFCVCAVECSGEQRCQWRQMAESYWKFCGE